MRRCQEDIGQYTTLRGIEQSVYAFLDYDFLPTLFEINFGPLAVFIQK